MINYPKINYAYRVLKLLHFHPDQTSKNRIDNKFYYSIRIIWFISYIITITTVVLFLMKDNLTPNDIETVTFPTMSVFMVGKMK